MSTAKRRTESTREVQAELRAFALVLSTIHGRLVALAPIIERQPAWRENERASIAGDDDRFTVEWSIKGLLGTDVEALEEVVQHIREDGELTEADAARQEAKSRKRRVQLDREFAREEREKQKRSAALDQISGAVERTTTALRKVADVLGAGRARAEPAAPHARGGDGG
jgi:hypothetical protein